MPKLPTHELAVRRFKADERRSATKEVTTWESSIPLNTRSRLGRVQVLGNRGSGSHCLETAIQEKLQFLEGDLECRVTAGIGGRLHMATTGLFLGDLG